MFALVVTYQLNTDSPRSNARWKYLDLNNPAFTGLSGATLCEVCDGFSRAHR